MNRLFLFFKLMAVGTFSLLVSACYGAPYRMDGLYWDMKSGTVKVKNGEGKPIPGLSVVVRDTARPDSFFPCVQTDVDGVAFVCVPFAGTYQVDITDPDGPENLGQFKPATRVLLPEGLEQADFGSLSIDVTLEEL